ncbi:MAG: DUF4917 family protein [Gammaproteobacteria bacterium]|nr:DUF4917 family protein [Gammaproteobacteria bacterium]
MTINLLTFDQAIRDSDRFPKRHLLIGNGFSIGCRPNIFQYASLYDQADFADYPEIPSVFERLGTQDFEEAIRALESASRLFTMYAPDTAAGQAKMREHAAALREILVETVARNHPENPNALDEEEIWSCRRFLKHFLCDKDGHVFTLNYDLLLYWTLMNEGNPFDTEAFELRKNDSFGNDEDDPDTEYVVWQGETAAHAANIHFLHGALHLFDAGAELQKYTWIRSGVPLIDQTRAAIEADKFPLFIAEGTSTQKKSRIRHNAYLYQSFKVLTANALTGTHCFFVFGHSLAESDEHILKRLGRGHFKKLYVSLFGDVTSDTNRAIIRRATELAAMRSARFPLEIAFFDAASANVWGRV